MKFPDRYRHPCKIGQGGMGEIYRATDSTLARDVAVKVLFAHHAADTDIRGRFTREALAAARLSGEPHTVAIYDVGEADGRPFIVMEYLPGGSLADRLALGRPAKPEALRWIDETARALDAAHALGVVHRDVKPANLLLDAAGHVHVADFGIASAVGLDSNTQTGVVLGTAGYLSPEQATGARATPASDVYALGVVAGELLGPQRPPEVEQVLDRAAARDPGARFASAGELAAALRAAYAGVEPPTVVMRRRPSRSALAAAAGLLLAGGAAAALLSTIGAGASSPPPTVSVVQTVTVPAPLPTTYAPPPPLRPKHERPDEKPKRHHDKKGKD